MVGSRLLFSARAGDEVNSETKNALDSSHVLGRAKSDTHRFTVRPPQLISSDRKCFVNGVYQSAARSAKYSSRFVQASSCAVIHGGSRPRITQKE